jgi:hypothetical protein
LVPRHFLKQFCRQKAATTTTTTSVHKEGIEKIENNAAAKYYSKEMHHLDRLRTNIDQSNKRNTRSDVPLSLSLPQNDFSHTIFFNSF